MNEIPESNVEDQPDHLPRHRERRRLSNLQIVFVAILSIGLLLVINLSGRIARGQQMETERRRLEATLDVLQRQKLELLKDRDYAASDSSVEQWAHTQGKMVRDGEVLVIPIPAGNTEPTPTAPAPVLASARVSQPQTPKWHLWWNLFFDGDPPF
jgi:hypothetical protein